jgi:hypothetical protein
MPSDIPPFDGKYMQHRTLAPFLRTFSALILLAVAGCGGNADSSSKNAQFRLLNLSTGYDSLDLYTNNGDQDSDTSHFTAVTTGSVSAYAGVKGDDYTITIKKTGTSGSLLSSSATLASDTHSTFVAFGAVNQFAVVSIDDDTEEPSSGNTKVRVLNTASEAVDVYLTGTSDVLDDVSATIDAAAAGAISGVVTKTSGTYRLRVTATGSKTDLRLNVPEISLPSAGVITIILTRASGGVLVNAVILPQQGSPTTYDNTATAGIRILNVSTGYDPLDLYPTSEGSSTDSTLFTAIARNTATSYASLKADTYSLKFRKNGSAGNLLTEASTLVEDKRVTYVAYGSSGGLRVFAVDEQTEAPDASYTKVQVLNGTTADGLDVYLTGADDALGDVSPAIGSITARASSGFSTIRSGTYRLRVTSGGSKTDVRLDVPVVTLPSTGVLSLVLTEATGGVLVSAVLLPQQGDPVLYANNTVRIRGAAGLTSGALVSMTVGGTEIVTRRSARSFIADTYTTRASGAAAVVVYVDNVAVGSGMVTLEPGHDYTLLAWDAGTSVQISLVADDNRPSATHRARVRLINAMSGSVVPVTLSVNYSPIAEYIEAGTVSTAAELDAGADYQFDVSNAQTLAPLLTRESVTLLADGVYTFFLAGGGTSTITATLRKDR